MQGAPWLRGMIAVSRPRAWIRCVFESHVRLKRFFKFESSKKNKIMGLTMIEAENNPSGKSWPGQQYLEIETMVESQPRFFKCLGERITNDSTN